MQDYRDKTGSLTAMQQVTFYFLLSAFCFLASNFANSDLFSLTVYLWLTSSFHFSGSIRQHVAFFDGECEVANWTSRQALKSSCPRVSLTLYETLFSSYRWCRWSHLAVSDHSSTSRGIGKVAPRRFLVVKDSWLLLVSLQQPSTLSLDQILTSFLHLPLFQIQTWHLPWFLLPRIRFHHLFPGNLHHPFWILLPNLSI